MAITSAELKKVRGFGPTDPVPYVGLDFENGMAHEVGEMSVKQEAQIFADNSACLNCPMSSVIQPAKSCMGCPYLMGFGDATGQSGESGDLSAIRVVCKFPKPRPVRPTGTDGPSGEYKDLLENNARALGRFSDTPTGEMERQVFVREGHVVNCPVSRANSGTWALAAPPCPACKHYAGMKLGEGGGKFVRCGHPRTIQLEHVALGADLLNEVG